MVLSRCENPTESDTRVIERGVVGDPLPPGCRPIEVHVADLKQLFNAMDPSPFRERELPPESC